MGLNTSLEMGRIGTTGDNISKQKIETGLQFIIWLDLLNRGLVLGSIAVQEIYNQQLRTKCKAKNGT